MITTGNSTARGFTLLEVLVAIVIAGILGKVTFDHLTKVVYNNQLEKASWNLFKDLGSSRPLALKSDATALVKFTGARCSTWVDTSGNGGYEANELMRVISLPQNISFGLPAVNAPTAAPTGASLPSTGGSSGVNWNAGLTIAKDAIGTINSGSVYLRHAKLNTITYCILMSAQSQKMKIFTWRASSWSEL